MSSHTIYTLEFESEEDVPNEDEVDGEVSFMIDEGFQHGRYLSVRAGLLPKRVDVLDEASELEDRVRFLFDKFDASRISRCSGNDTSDWSEHVLFGKSKAGDVEKIEEENDTDAAEPLFSSWELDEHHHEFRSSKKKINEENDFDSWDWIDISRARRKN